MAFGKIAHLPPHIRHELNRRLDNGEMGVRLVEWLNTIPDVKQVLESHFDSHPISEQNLSEWKEHGYRDWRSQQDSVALTREIIANARELLAQCGGELTESLATVVAARYAAALKKSQEEITDELRDELKVLKGISRETVRLRRSNQMLQQLQIKQQRLQFEQSKYENRKNATDPASRRSEAKTDESLTQEEKDRQLKEWLYPRDLFPERYEPQSGAESTPANQPTPSNDFLPHEPGSSGRESAPSQPTDNGQPTTDKPRNQT